MDHSLCNQLLIETIQLAEEENVTSTYESFMVFIEEMLPPDVLNTLRSINYDSLEFLEDIWREKYNRYGNREDNDDVLDSEFQPGICCVCERQGRLTKHHLFPREMHKRLIKKGYESKLLNEATIPVCRMCHSAIHRFFTNDDLAESFYSLELLLDNEKFAKYAKWASGYHNY